MPPEEKKNVTTVQAPPPRGPRFAGNPFANLPQEVRDRMLAERSKAQPKGGLAGTPQSVGTGGTWGSSGAGVDGAYGTVTTARIKRRAEKEKYPDNNGETTAYLYYDYGFEGSFECLVQGTLEPGDAVQIGGQTLYVNDAEKQWENKGWSKYSVTAEKHDGIA